MPLHTPTHASALLHMHTTPNHPHTLPCFVLGAAFYARRPQRGDHTHSARTESSLPSSASDPTVLCNETPALEEPKRLSFRTATTLTPQQNSPSLLLNSGGRHAGWEGADRQQLGCAAGEGAHLRRQGAGPHQQRRPQSTSELHPSVVSTSPSEQQFSFRRASATLATSTL